MIELSTKYEETTLVQQENEAGGSGGGGGPWEIAGIGGCVGVKAKQGGQRRGKQIRVRDRIRSSSQVVGGDDNYENVSEEDPGGGVERQREHPFIVTEPGEVARGKKMDFSLKSLDNLLLTL